MALDTGGIFNEVIGHATTKKRLLTLFRSQKIPHAFLFVGPAGQGKKKVARGFAQTLLCEKSLELGEACGTCRACQSVVQNQSVGVLLLEPEKGVIKIEAARALLRQLSLATWGKARVVIIDDAQTLNPQAANALLKSIEEPPEKTYFILITHSQDSVLKTICSRTQIVRFTGLTTQEKSQLQFEAEVSPVDEAATQVLQLLVQRDLSSAVNYCREHIDGREQALQATRGWLTSVRNDWHAKGFNLPQEQLARWSLLVLAAERDLQGHCDVQLTLENCLNEMSLT